MKKAIFADNYNRPFAAELRISEAWEVMTFG